MNSHGSSPARRRSSMSTDNSSVASARNSSRLARGGGFERSVTVTAYAGRDTARSERAVSRLAELAEDPIQITNRSEIYRDLTFSGR